MKKTLGNLIDELSITNQKIWACEDIKHLSQSDKEIAAACRKTNILNPLRNRLIQEIDELFNELGANQQLYGQGSTKVYGKK
jgi:hypothetical protein